MFQPTISSKSTMTLSSLSCSFFFFNDAATTEIYTLSLHDALPISRRSSGGDSRFEISRRPTSDMCSVRGMGVADSVSTSTRSEEHTSELQSQSNLVCRLLLEKKKTTMRVARQKAGPTQLPDTITRG